MQLEHAVRDHHLTWGPVPNTFYKRKAVRHIHTNIHYAQLLL